MEVIYRDTGHLMFGLLDLNNLMMFSEGESIRTSISAKHQSPGISHLVNV